MNRRERKRGIGIGQWMVVLLSTFGLLLTGCYSHRNEEHYPNSGANDIGTISFAPSVSETWFKIDQETGQGAETTRANADSGIGSVVDAHSLMLGEVAGDSLYLHITTTEGIEGNVVDTTTDNETLRAAPVTDVQTYRGFGVTAYHYNAGSRASGTPNLMNKVHYNTYNTGSGGHWTAASTYRWMPGRVHDFYAWAPYSTTGYSVNSPTGGAAPTITVTIPNSVADQKDLLVAKATGVTVPSSGIQQLHFKHALTAVRFVAKEMNAGIEITSITLQGVLNQGTYDFRTEQWTLRSGQPRVSFTQTLPRPVTSTGVSGQQITDGATTFMMLPQQFNSSTPLTVKVSYRDGGKTGEIRGVISTPHRWEAGKTVTYEISSSSINWTYNFELTEAPTSVSHKGGTSTFKITSTRQKGTNGAVEPVSFKIKEIYDEATKRWTSTIPKWFNGGNTISSTGGTNVGGSISIAAQTTSIQGIPGLAALQNATPKGTRTAPYTLEDEGGTVPAETANCYVIQAPGHYSLPLVYGNAITNGATNSSAYTYTKTDIPTYQKIGSSTIVSPHFLIRILSPFINHDGDPITRPDLPPILTRAGIIWQDEKDLVTNVRLDTSNPSNMRLLFEVNKNTIREGNAVIAVYYGSSAVWSWHIWVTAQEVFNPISVKTSSEFGSQEFKFMPCNLGEARGGTTDTFPRRALRAKVVQSGSNREVEVTFVQKEGAEVGGHRSPYYQWGRKDPFIPSNGINNTFHTWYDSHGNRQTSNPPFTYSRWGVGEIVQNSIANPGTFNTEEETIFFNLWNNNYPSETTQSDYRVIKTIYDPSPRGYAIPPVFAFSGLSTSGATFDRGYHFRTGYPAPNDKIYFPASGLLPHMGVFVYDVGNKGYYWTAEPYGDDHGFYLIFDTDNEASIMERRSNGYSVRPAKIN